jgi:hypothetical protein
MSASPDGPAILRPHLGLPSACAGNGRRAPRARLPASVSAFATVPRLVHGLDAFITQSHHGQTAFATTSRRPFGGSGLRRTEGARVIVTPIQAPNANAHAQRVIETVRAECLDWTLILGRRRLDRTLRTYVDHYNRGRPHRAIDLAPPRAEAWHPMAVSPRDVRRPDLLGGLIHEDHGAAA